MNIEQLNKQMFAAYNAAGLTGRGVVDYFIGTGILPVGILSNVKSGSTRGLVDDGPHETGVACITKERCPDAEIWSFNHSPKGVRDVNLTIQYMNDVLRMALADPARFHALNLSFSTSGTYNASLKAIDEIGKKLTAAGVPVFVSAGNDGNELATMQYLATLSWPIMCVGLKNDGSKHPSSCYGIDADFADQYEVETINTAGRSVVGGGTSYTAPLILSKGNLEAELLKAQRGRWPTVAELVSALKSKTIDLDVAGHDKRTGNGFIQLGEPNNSQGPVAPDKEEPYMTNNELDFVVDPKLRWARALGKMKRIDTIVVHHSGSDGGTVQRIHQQHLNEGHAGCDYNYVIEVDGTIHKGRGLIYEGGHVGNEKSNDLNEHAIGICLPGAIHKHAPTAEQVVSAKKLISAILALNGKSVGGVPVDVKTIIGHKEVPYYVSGKLQVGKPYPTACPGAYMPMAEFKALLTGEVVEPEPEQPSAITLPALYAYTGASSVNVRIGPGTENGVIGKLSAGQKCIVLAVKDGWAEIILHELNPMLRGFCIDTYLRRM